MSPKKQKRAQQIQRDDQGRLLLSGGLFAKKLVLTEEQASEFQPLLDGFSSWRKRVRRWILACGAVVFVVCVVILLVLQYATDVGPELHGPIMLATVCVFNVLAAVAVQLNCKKQPWYQAYVDLHKHLHKNAPRV